MFLQGRLLLVALSKAGGAETVFGFVAGPSQACHGVFLKWPEFPCPAEALNRRPRETKRFCLSD